MFKPRKLFGPKRKELTGGWRKLHIEELHNLYSPNTVWAAKSRIMRCVSHVAHMGVKRSAYRVNLGKTAGKRRLGKPRRRWEDNVKTDLEETGWESIGWVDLA
jgi:hypothetical protein